jgi:ornithine carbamoyltransferase
MAEAPPGATITPMLHVAPAPAAPRSLLALSELEPWQVRALLDLGAVMKRHPHAWHHSLESRTVACVFEPSSIAGRLAFFLAVHRLGAWPIAVTPEDLRTTLGGSPAGAARTLSDTCDAIAAHALSDRDLSMLAEHARVPVLNVHTRRCDPWQGLTDCLTLQERFGALDGLAVAYVGASDHVAQSLLELAPRTGIALRLSAPGGVTADPWAIASAGRWVRVTDDPAAAVAGADVIYTDTDGHPVTAELLSGAAPDALVLHAAARADTPDHVPMAQALLYTAITGDWEV